MSIYDEWDGGERCPQSPNEIPAMKKETKTHTKKTKNQKQSIPVSDGCEHQYILDELARLRTKQMILEDNMDRSVSEVRNTVAMLSNRILENWNYEYKKQEKKLCTAGWWKPSHTWYHMRDQIKIAIYDHIISKFIHRG
jgi:hypothetical protein